MLKGLEEYKDTNMPKISGKKIDGEDIFRSSEIEEEPVLEESVYEDIIKKQRKFKLFGHTDAVFSVSISPDKKYIISGSYDEAIRLWSIYTKTTLVVYKGHFSPVLSVKFSPFSYNNFCNPYFRHYFASGGCDRTARLWAMNSPGPLRIFVGHLADVELVDFHPNSFYLVTSANDKTIRLYY